jgi:hypothetical protein
VCVERREKTVLFIGLSKAESDAILAAQMGLDGLAVPDATAAGQLLRLRMRDPS